MKKKLLFTLCAAFIITIASCTAALAYRCSGCPVTLSANYNSSTTVNEFDIYNVENLYGQYKNRLYYTFEDTGYISLSLVCYDAQGMQLQTLDFNRHAESIDVPDTTAMVELVPSSPSYTTDTLFHCKYLNVYSADGRAMGITDLQVPIYKMVGWYPEVTVYADDGREMNISPFQVDAYAQVGWYTIEVSAYRTICQLYNSYKSSRDYLSIIEMIDEYLPYYEGTSYAQSMYAMKTDAMDCWRVSINSPMGFSEYEIGENSIGTPEATLYFTNVSYKTISAFKVKFTCYNIFGNVEKTYYDYYYCDDTNMEPSKTFMFTWTLYGADSVNSVKNVYVTEVVFSDGTKWYR